MKIWRDTPLLVRIPILTAAMMVFVGVLASQQVMSSLSRLQRQELQELSRMHLEGLRVALLPAVLRRDVWEAFDTLERATLSGDQIRPVFTVVTDETRHVIAASNPLRAKVGADASLWLEMASRPSKLAFQAGDANVFVTTPILYQGAIIGELATELDISGLTIEREKALTVLVLGNALATIALAFTAFYLTRRMLGPMITLTKHMASDPPERIADESVPKGDTEVARFFKGYNKMIVSIEARNDAERRLAERERYVSLGRLSSTLAHEINNPLGGLLNAVDTIQEYPDRKDVVTSAASLLERGLKNLRDVARATLETHRSNRSQEKFSLEDVDDLRLLIEPESRRFGQTLEWETVPADLGNADVPAGPTRQILLNLLLNAVSAAGNGGTVGLRFTNDQNGLHMTVSDSGLGLDPASRQKLLESGSSLTGGGVGLRLVREMTLQLGGTIMIPSARSPTEIEVTFAHQNREQAVCC